MAFGMPSSIEILILQGIARHYDEIADFSSTRCIYIYSSRISVSCLPEAP